MINMTTIHTDGTATARAVHYAINSSASHMSREAQEAMAIIAQRVGQLLTTTVQGDAGAPGHWRVIAAAALQIEARSWGLDYTSLVHDKPLTPD